MFSMQTASISQNTASVKNNSSIANDKYSEQEYSNYIDSSDVVISTYKNSSTVGLEKYFLKIEEWFDKPLESQEDNKPYVIEADEGVGKKTLLVKWMEYHETKKKKVILSSKNIIYEKEAAGAARSIRYSIKVELLEEKLRKYFSYWLNHCSDKLEKQLKYGEKVNYDKVIIIIEGIDQFIDQQYNKEANVAFWLPKYFPEHIKMIVTCDKNSQANAYFRLYKNI